MNHLSPEQLIEIYCGEMGSAVREHLQACSQCAEEYRLWEELLGAVCQMPVPEPEAGYEYQVWARLTAQLPRRRTLRDLLSRPWILAPALTVFLTIAFVAGMLTQQRRHPSRIPAQARERVLLISLGDHLERSQMLLTELLNTPPGSLDWAEERSRARDLLTENRLLRQTSARAGDATRTALLDDLERGLLDVANSPPSLSNDEMRALQTQIKNDGLLFKVRITSAGVRHEGQI